MITKHTIAAGATVKVLDAGYHPSVLMINYTEGVVGYASFEGTATPTGPAGATPGVPIAFGFPVENNQDDHRDSTVRTNPVYVHNLAGAAASIVLSVHQS